MSHGDWRGPVKTLCAWCGVTLEDGPSDGGEADGARGSSVPARYPGPDPVSHGICPECAAGFEAEEGQALPDFLAHIGVPILLMDGDAEVLEINPSGQVRFRVSDLRPGIRMGEVFTCANASAPGGCGGTIHCSGCAIRMVVEETHRTGEPAVRVPATLRVTAPGAEPRAEFFLSSVRLGDRILLRVDPAG